MFVSKDSFVSLTIGEVAFNQQPYTTLLTETHGGVTRVMKRQGQSGGDLYAPLRPAYLVGSVIPFFAGYQPVPTAATPTFSPAGGTFTSAQSVTLSDSTGGAAIHYTTDGSTPTASSPTYSSPIAVSATTTIKAIATASGYNASAVASATYTISTGTSLIDRTSETGGLIQARGDNAPDEDKTKAFDNNLNTKWLDFSATSWISYQFANSVSYIITEYKITSGNDNAAYPGRAPKNWVLKGSNDGTNWTNLDTRTNVADTANLDTQVYDFANSTAYKIYKLDSIVSNGDPILQISEIRLLGPAGGTTPTAATPTFSPAGGTFTSAQSVMISDSTGGAAIHYTTNGTTPTASSPTYSGPIAVSATTTLKALATASGYNASAVASATYTISTGAGGAYNGPHSIPGTLQAEDYDTGGEGSAYHDTDSGNNGGSYRTDAVDIQACTDTGGGYNVGWTAAGEYLKYTVSVASAGTYSVGFRIASTTAGNTFHLENSSGTNLTGTLTCPNTGGWQTWQTVTATVPLPAGTQVLKLVEDTGGYNFNSVVFTSAGTTSGSLVGSGKTFTSATTVNLTATGPTDWAHWGLGGTTKDHKSTGGNAISSYSVIGGGGVNTYGDNLVGFTWTNGTPTSSVTNTRTGVYTGGSGKGFSFTVPAGTTAKTLTVYVGGYNSDGKLTAHLSDGSAADFVDSSYGFDKAGNADGSHYYAAYTLTYNAASAGKTLTVSWVQTTSGGNVTLQAVVD